MDYKVTDTELTAVANAIRTKGGTSAPLEWNSGFVDAIGDIQTGITPVGNINITNTQSTDVSAYATAQVVDANLIAENIKKDVVILGITGTYDGGGLTPITEQELKALIGQTNYARLSNNSSDRLSGGSFMVTRGSNEPVIFIIFKSGTSGSCGIITLSPEKPAFSENGDRIISAGSGETARGTAFYAYRVSTLTPSTDYIYYTVDGNYVLEGKVSSFSCYFTVNNDIINFVGTDQQKADIEDFIDYLALL